MITRKDLGSWLDGPETSPSHVPGSTWDLPAQGTDSVAGYGRRFLGLLVDWGIAAGIGYFAFAYDPLANLAIFCIQMIAFQTLFGASPGQFALGLRVRPVTGRLPMLVRMFIRTAILLTVISGLLLSQDKQPLHDLAAGTAVVRA